MLKTGRWRRSFLPTEFSGVIVQSSGGKQASTLPEKLSWGISCSSRMTCHISVFKRRTKKVFKRPSGKMATLDEWPHQTRETASETDVDYCSWDKGTLSLADVALTSVSVALAPFSPTVLT